LSTTNADPFLFHGLAMILFMIIYYESKTLYEQQKQGIVQNIMQKTMAVAVI
jgi:hypothetical protein